TQMNFIKTAIGSLNYPARLRGEGEYGSEFNWNSRLNISQMQFAINSAEQTEIPFSLLQQLSSLVTSVENLDAGGNPIGAVIFISDTSDDALRNADRLLPKLKNVKLTFILLGENVVSSKLRNFTSNFIYWQDLTQPEPDNWDLLYYRAYACDIPFVPSTTTTTTETPYIPCHSWISFGIDDSSNLSPQAFRNQINFISSQISTINHPERIAAASVYTDYVYWTPWNTIFQIQSDLQLIKESSNPYFLRDIFASLTSNVIDNSQSPYQMASIIFISDTSDNAINGAEAYMKNFGLVRFTFILLGPYPDPNKLKQFSSNFIYWRDLSQTQPENWGNFSSFAYGC
uniref:VWFA domain-containing protein n=1 Tax=Panagrolaimus sp. PS1159 TaxID=55785 RepID=A0AC35F1X6_9BILA